MAYADPQSVTITGFNGGSAISLPRVIDNPTSSTYRDPTNSYELVITSQQAGKGGTLAQRYRRSFRLNVNKYSTNPLETTKNLAVSASVYLMVDMPVTGFTQAELTNIAAALMGLLTASSNASLIKLIGGEH
jgi:hypothetical protein